MFKNIIRKKWFGVTRNSLKRDFSDSYDIKS